MIFDLDNLNPGAIFYFDSEKPEGGGVELRQMTEGELDRIRKATQKKIMKHRGSRPYPEIKKDQEKFDLMFWDYCIMTLVDMVTPDEAPIENTAENKLALMKGSKFFAAFVADSLESLDVFEEQEAEEERKN